MIMLRILENKRCRRAILVTKTEEKANTEVTEQSIEYFFLRRIIEIDPPFEAFLAVRFIHIVWARNIFPCYGLHMYT